MATTNIRLGLLLAACGLLLVLSLWLSQQTGRQDSRLFSPSPCDNQQLRQGCIAQQAERQISLQLNSYPVSSHSPVEFQVRLQGYQAEQVEIELQGRDMYMGQLRVQLQPDANGNYRGNSQLPSCTTGKMIWRATVWVSEQGQQSGSWFDFEAL